MGAFRLLVWGLLIFAVFWLGRRLLQRRPNAARRAEPAAAPMVRCAHCGLHVPQAEALSSADRWYCCTAHRERDQHAEHR